MFSTSKKLALTFGGIVLLSLGVYAGLFYYIFSHHASIGELQKTLESEVGKKETLQADKRLYEDFALAKEELAQAFVAKEGEVAFIEIVENLGKEVGVEIQVQGISREELGEKGNAAWENLELNVRARGTWQQLLTLFALVENLPMRVSISNFTLTTSQSGSEIGATKGAKKAALWESGITLHALKAK